MNFQGGLESTPSGSQNPAQAANQSRGFVAQLREAETHDSVQRSATRARQLQQNGPAIELRACAHQIPLLFEPVCQFHDRVVFEPKLSGDLLDGRLLLFREAGNSQEKLILLSLQSFLARSILSPS